MTTIIDEHAAGPAEEPTPGTAAPQGASEAGAVAATVAAVGLAVGGVVHFALLPHHAEDWLAEGLVFGLVGALQIASAVAVLARPRRAVLLAAIPLAIVPPVIWFWRVRWGLPVGPESGVPEAADFVGRFTAAVEVAAFLALLVGVLRPAARQPSTTAGGACSSADRWSWSPSWPRACCWPRRSPPTPTTRAATPTPTARWSSSR